MQVQLNTDRTIDGNQELEAHVRGVVEDSLSDWNERVTRVEVHLSDQNSDKGGPDDKKCLMEARIAGCPPTAVSHRAATVDEAILGAAEKLARVVEGAERQQGNAPGREAGR